MNIRSTGLEVLRSNLKAVFVFVGLFCAYTHAADLPQEFVRKLGLTHRNYANCRNEVLIFHKFLVTGYMVDTPEMLHYLNTPFCRPVNRPLPRYGEIVAIFMGEVVNGTLASPVDHAAIILNAETVYEKPDSNEAYQIGKYSKSIDFAAARLRPSPGATIQRFECVSPNEFTHGFRDVRVSYKNLWAGLNHFEESLKFPGNEFITLARFKSVAGRHFKNPQETGGSEVVLRRLIVELPPPNGTTELALLQLIKLRLSAEHVLPYTFRNAETGLLLAERPWLSQVNLMSWPSISVHP